MSSPIIYAAIYFIIVVIIGAAYARKQSKTMDGFTKGGQSLNWIMVAFALTLIPLGAGHTMNLWEQAPGMGAGVLWWGLIVGGIFLPLCMLWFGPWLRQLGANTFSHSMEMEYGKTMGYLHAIINVSTWTGIVMGEILASAAAIYGLTGGAIPYAPWSIVIAFVLMMLYIIVGGVLQYAVVSVVNAIVMIVGSYVALFMIGGWLVAQGLGWSGIEQLYVSAGEVWKFDVFSFSPDLVYLIIIPVAVLHIAASAVNQGQYIPLFSARSDQDCRKGLFVASGVNGLASFPWIMMALIAAVIPRFAAAGEKLSVINLSLEALPAPIVGVLMICLLIATLSTGAAVVMGNSHLIVNVILKGACFPNMKQETELKLMRPMIIICGLASAIPAFFVPIIFPVFLWCFSFGIPVCVVWFIGMVWKRNKAAAWITVLVTFAVNFIWTFATPAWPPAPFNQNIYPVTVVSLVLGIVLNLILPGEKGLLRQMREKKAQDTVTVGS